MWHFDRVTNADGWIRIFTSGLRVDFASICYLFILPALLTSLISGEHWLGRIWNWILRLWITAGLWIVVYMEVATPPFIIEYDLRLIAYLWNTLSIRKKSSVCCGRVTNWSYLSA